MQLTEHQQVVIDKLLKTLLESIETKASTYKFVELNGAAGVGKTFSTIEIVKELQQYDLKIAFAAPTHAALSVIKKINKEVKGDMFLGTIHSFLNLIIENDLDTGDKILKSAYTEEEDANKCDVLIVDEKSMLCKEIMDKILISIRMGYVKAVLLIGDGFQLPCVNGYPIKPFPNFFELTEIVRQNKDNPIIDFATTIRQAIEFKDYPVIEDLLKIADKKIMIFDDEKDFLNHFYNISDNENSKIIGAYENATVNTFNNKIMKHLNPNKEYVEPGFSFILQNTNNTLQDNKWTHTHNNGEKIYISEVVKITYGEKFISNSEALNYSVKEFEEEVDKHLYLLKNMMNIKIENLEYYYCKTRGEKTIIILNEAAEQNLKSILNNLKETALLAPTTELRQKYFMLFFNLRKLFANVKYSYANTFHKLQGSSYEHVGIDIRTIERNKHKSDELNDTIFRLLYVGVTRASNTLFILKNKPIILGGPIDF
jgi:ATP-dependent exoDNAse (exonuclease V) alpha subunit